MIDWDDVDFAVLAAPAGIVGLVIVIVITWFAWANDSDCSKRTCPGDARPKLMAHECLCVSEAKP